MSHFTKLSKAQITSAEAFIAACKELGLKDITKNGHARGYRGTTIAADVVVKLKGNYDIALVKSKEKKNRFDCIADWSMMRGEYNQDFQDRLVQLTTKHTLIQKYQRLGFRAAVTEDAQKNLVLSLTRA